MRRAKWIVLALGALGEAGQAVAHPERADAVAASGQDLVRVGLMADVPDDPVCRRLEDVVQGDRELDHAEARAEMAAGDRDRVDGFRAQLVRDLPKLALLEPAEVIGGVDLIQEGRLRRYGHQQSPRQTIERMELPGADGAGRSPSHKGSRVDWNPARFNRFKENAQQWNGSLWV